MTDQEPSDRKILKHLTTEIPANHLKAVLLLPDNFKLLKHSDQQKIVISEDTSNPQTITTKKKGMFCKSCDQLIAQTGDIFSMDDENPQHIFTNPIGKVYDLITVRKTIGVGAIGEPSAEFSWYLGYLWQVAYCLNCEAHLGWLFTCTSEHHPQYFYGLIKDHIIIQTKKFD